MASVSKCKISTRNLGSVVTSCPRSFMMRSKRSYYHNTEKLQITDVSPGTLFMADVPCVGHTIKKYKEEGGGLMGLKAT